MREAIEPNSGRVVKTTGDGFHAVFESAADGVWQPLAGQQAMIAETWPAETGPLRVRMGLHTGASRQRDGDYYGSEVNRAARSWVSLTVDKSCISGPQPPSFAQPRHAEPHC